MNIEKEILETCSVIAIVGLSSNMERPSHHVGIYLKENGYKVIPINPSEKMIFGEKCYPDLIAVPEQIDVVDIFRRSEDVDLIVEDAIKIKAKAVWMQEGITNNTAAKKAIEAGLKVVQNKCIKKEHSRWLTE
jgi:predicted CoA-binding protein